MSKMSVQSITTTPRRVKLNVHLVPLALVARKLASCGLTLALQATTVLCMILSPELTMWFHALQVPTALTSTYPLRANVSTALLESIVRSAAALSLATATKVTCAQVAPRPQPQLAFLISSTTTRPSLDPVPSDTIAPTAPATPESVSPALTRIRPANGNASIALKAATAPRLVLLPLAVLANLDFIASLHQSTTSHSTTPVVAFAQLVTIAPTVLNTIAQLALTRQFRVWPFATSALLASTVMMLMARSLLLSAPPAIIVLRRPATPECALSVPTPKATWWDSSLRTSAQVARPDTSVTTVPSTEETNVKKATTAIPKQRRRTRRALSAQLATTAWKAQSCPQPVLTASTLSRVLRARTIARIAAKDTTAFATQLALR